MNTIHENMLVLKSSVRKQKRLFVSLWGVEADLHDLPLVLLVTSWQRSR
ncbi:MAG: hypothetical protein U1A23_05210 [Candidatus Sungbacteria bacterium]|nr:hypothetical protein [Candidatus Sungbacteria bacterium]